MSVSRILPLLAAALLLGGCGPADAPGFASTDITGADFGKTFSATDHNGKPRSLEDFRGKVVTLFFGFTHCPDVCPTSLATMAQVMQLLGEDAGRVQVLFMTIDPERDTPALLAAYVPQFHPSFQGLYADPQTTAGIARDFKVFYQKVPGATPDSYSMDHAAGTYVFDPQGRLRLYVKHGEAPERIAADLRLLLAGR
jgi:protein SCO1/2